MARRVPLILVGALALAACRPTPPAAVAAASARPAATGAPSARPSGAAQTTVRPAEPAFLRAPAAGTVPLRGRVRVDAGFVVRRGAGTLLASGDVAIGAGIVSNNGARLVAADGTVVTDAGGTVIAPDGGGAVVLDDAGSALVSNNGGSVIGNNGANVIGSNGASIIGSNGASVVGGNGASVVGGNGAAYRLAQADAAPAYGEARGAAGMWLSLVDPRTGFTVPLGVDPAGQPVYTVYTGADGGFTLHVPPEVAARGRLVARAPGGGDARLVCDAFAAGATGDVAVDEDSAVATALIRVGGAGKFARNFGTTTAPGNAAESALDVMFAPLREALAEIGAGSMDPRRRQQLGLLLTDALLAEVDLAGATLTTAGAELLDPAAAAALEGRPLLAETALLAKHVREAAVRAAAGQADQAAFFGAKRWLIAANLNRPAAERYRIERAADVGDFLAREYLASGEPIKLAAAKAVMLDLGVARVDLDRLDMIFRAVERAAVGGILAASADEGPSLIDRSVALVHDLGARIVRAPAPPAPTAPPGPVAALPTPPSAGAWLVETIAGQTGEAGLADGDAATARFATPNGLAFAPGADPPVLYVAEQTKNRIRRVTLAPAGLRVETVAGTDQPGLADGPGLAARFHTPTGLACDAQGRLLVADRGNHAIRRLAFGPDGAATVETLAGGGGAGFADGPGAAARFDNPRGLAVGADGAVWVADFGNHRVRRIDADAPGRAVMTMMGGRFGLLEGPLAELRVESPTDVAFAPDGALWLLQGVRGLVSRVAPPLGPQATATLIAGGSLPDPASDGYGINAGIRLATGLAITAGGEAVVVEQDGRRLVRVTPDGWLTHLAGDPGRTGGVADGDERTARFGAPTDVAAGPDGALYVADWGNHTIRRVRKR